MTLWQLRYAIESRIPVWTLVFPICIAGIALMLLYLYRIDKRT